MKPFLFLVFFALFLPFALAPQVHTADAAGEGRYAVAAESNVRFYSAESEESYLFTLPQSYYVRVLSEGETWCAVSYLEDEGLYRAITGYCRTDTLTFVKFVPANPYLKRTVSLTYSLDEKTFFGSGSLQTFEREAVYYGLRYFGDKLCFYVGFDGQFDYVVRDTPLVYERNTDYLESDNVTTGGTAEAGSLSAGHIVAIVAVCAAAVAVAALLLRGKRAPVPREEVEAEF